MALAIIRPNGTVVHKYTPKEDEFIRKNADKGGVYLASQLGRKAQSIRDRAMRLKVKLGKKK